MGGEDFMGDDKKLPARRGTWQDADTALLKGAIGSIPVVGSILGELVGLILPDQRIDRLEDFVRRLAERLDSLDPEALREQFRDPESVDLFEEGAVQSVRAVSDERRAYIASVVSEGLSGDAKDRIQAKRLLRLLAQIDDDQIIILASHLRKNSHDDEFFERHQAVLHPVSNHLGADQDEMDAAAMYELARAELVQLGLLRANFKSTKKGENPEFDSRTGMVKASGRQITSLGRLLLRQIGVAGPDDP
jgi:hypothetical protein